MVSRKLKEHLKQYLPMGAVRLYHALRVQGIRVSHHFFAQIHKGTTYFCPFCNGRFNRFLPDGANAAVLHQYGVIGGGYRTNCLCPACGSKDRERLLLLYLQQYTKMFTPQQPPLHVLHVAPEPQLKKLLQKLPYLHYLNADLNPGAADVQMDITAILYPDATFDAILCNHVLEHIPDDAQAMSELYRVLKPNGWAILQVPYAQGLPHTYENPHITHPADRETHFGQFDHVRIYGQDYVTRLNRAGFSVTVLTAKEAVGIENVQKLSLIADERIFVGNKLM
ncbi:MAG TPA: methyltransferase domain-containing protein [Chitinophagales bacterium]|nr:methyltransferase domain-containing protein [Chitinophagales bacterium]HRK27645.1 methyltransferase domain-containing protein [Chitinophagales bacterium]